MGTKGLTEAVVAETNIALQAHELIKIKVNGAEKPERLAMIEELCVQLKADLVQMIGNTAVVYRKNEEQPKPKVLAAKPKKTKQSPRRL